MTDKPVALMHEHPDHCGCEFEEYRNGAGCLTDADKADGWVETPLYARPAPAQGDVEEEAADALVKRLRDEGGRNGGQGAYAWTARELCLKAATALAAKDAEIASLKAEMERRDSNENRNCLNWGPCSRHDGRMADASILAEPARAIAGEGE